MENDRIDSSAYLTHARAVAHVTDRANHGDARQRVLELLLDLVKCVLVRFVKHEERGAIARDLPAQLGAYRRPATVTIRPGQ